MDRLGLIGGVVLERSPLGTWLLYGFAAWGLFLSGAVFVAVVVPFMWANLGLTILGGVALVGVVGVGGVGYALRSSPNRGRYLAAGLLGLGGTGVALCAGLTVLGGSVKTKFAPIEAEDYGMNPSVMELAADDGDYSRADAAKPAAARERSEGALQIIRGGAKKTVNMAAVDPEPSPDRDGDDDSGGERVRSWFPEAFLWRPLVETDAAGTAIVDVRVPDQLTTWRVLALAHTRAGAQAGDLVTFDSSLPLYVDPVVPGWLHAGDRIDLPVQVVNPTDAAVSAPLTITSTGALSGQASAQLSLPAGGTAVQIVALTADGAGVAHVVATLTGGDAVDREIVVVPRGRPVETTRGGTLSATTAFTLGAPEAADPTTQELSVLVYPGPLAVLQSELERGGSGSRPTDAAYGFAIATHLAGLAAKSKVSVDEAALRRLRILAWQRVVPHARAPDAGAAADLLAGLRGTVGNEQATELIARLETLLVTLQRGDGSWSRSSSATLQEVLVQTAVAGRQIPADRVGARLRASSFLDRNRARILDPYTAAVVLASGLVDGEHAETLRAIVTAAANDAGDGRRTIPVPAGTKNPWGATPSSAEMLAWAVLALPADVAWRGDLVAELMSGYDGARGFGAGPADTTALAAVTDALPGLDQPVDVILTVDGVEVSRAKLDPTQPKRPAVLAARGPVGEIGLSMSPPVPGLAFAATRRVWIPWSGAEKLAGVDVTVAATPMRVGQDTTITLTLAAPSGTALTIEQGLPAGAVVDEHALAAIADRIVDFSVSTDRVRLVTRGFQAGEIMVVPIVVRPVFAGEFSTTPLVIAPGRDAAGGTSLQPLVWTVSG